MPGNVWNKAKLKQEEQARRALFEQTVLPYFGSGYNLARWLTRNDHDAQDVIQESSMRAWRSFDTFVLGRDARAWFLAIVRNTCRSWQKQNQASEPLLFVDDCQAGDALDPELELIKKADSQMVRRALEELPFEYREILILRELEELSYKEISKIAEIPLGTVMSRLSRARKQLYTQLGKPTGEAAR
jgi:RNA polymerase sigma-70 factor (ECF subfamily)